MLRNLSWPITIILSAIGVGILTWGDSGSFLRPIVSFWFTLVCPGMSIIGLLHFKDRLAELVLAIALSLSITTILAEVMALTQLWSPIAGLGILIGISLIGATLQIKSVLPIKKPHIDQG